MSPNFVVIIHLLFVLSSTSIPTSTQDPKNILISEEPTLALFYKEHHLRTDQLCPDIQESISAKDIDTANHPYKSVFKLADQVWKSSDPCVFESRGPRAEVTTVMVKAIRASPSPWNYTSSSPCSEHIKLKLPSRRVLPPKGGSLPLCTVRKPPSPLHLFQGAFYSPRLWQLGGRGKKMGISFSIYENDTLPTVTAAPNNIFLMDAKLPSYMHLLFAVFHGDACSLRVQQYAVDPKRTACGSPSTRFLALCGMYPCLQGEEETILREMGFWDETLNLEEMAKLVDLLRGHRRSPPPTPSVLDFFMTLVRLMLLPLSILFGVYVSRQLRERWVERQVLSLQIRRRRSLVSSDHRPRDDIPTSTEMSQFFTADLPPSYDVVLENDGKTKTAAIFSVQMQLAAQQSEEGERSPFRPPPPSYEDATNTTPTIPS